MLTLANKFTVFMSEERSLNFIEEIIENDLNSGKYETLDNPFSTGT